jgi:adenine-specific DNA methylase
MALQKDFEYKNTGVIANYTNMKKKDVRIDTTDGSGMVLVRTYLNNAARQANKNELINKQYALPVGTFSTLNLATTDPRDAVYIYLKTLPEFTGAIDL